MANTNRRRDFINKYGAMFIPMNVEGSNYNDSFFSMKKIVTIFIILLMTVVIAVYFGSSGTSVGGFIVIYAIWFFIISLLVRFIIFEEKYYLEMYRLLKKYEVSTPAIFWDISSRKHTDDGTIVTFSDGKVGIFVRLERDTITGKTEDFKEYHYDAWSDFYNSLMSKRYKVVQMNLMEPAGKDPRLAELDKLTYKDDNPNICALTEMMLAHIKDIARNSLFETEYLLIYTEDMSKIDKIIDDIGDSMLILMNGAYVGYTVLNDKEISDRVREEYGVGYFNATEASLTMFRGQVDIGEPPFKVVGIKWDNEKEQKLNDKERMKLNSITSGVIRETVKQKEVSLKDSLYREEEKEKIGIDFDSLSNVGTKSKGKFNKGILSKKGKTEVQKAEPKAEAQKVQENVENKQSSNEVISLDEFDQDLLEEPMDEETDTIDF